uniref:E3 ubiquitin-protein ligase MSL2 n=1 Tax=Clastoptera arizonana TaxID=38151 RepID=A0A1B6CVS3_9HEMI
MNATSLYVSTCRLVLQSNGEDSTTWTDLYRLIPYLRQSLSCTVCGKLLIEPYTPTETNCQHHVCRSCKGGRKKLKPSCSWCKNYDKYIENVQLRVLLQCYKKLCQYMTSTVIFKNLVSNAPSNINCNLSTEGTPNLFNLIKEGLGFVDEFQPTCGLRKSAFSFFPNIITTSTSTQTIISSADLSHDFPTTDFANEVQTNKSQSLQNGISLYSVRHTGNKLTIKRKATEMEDDLQDELTDKKFDDTSQILTVDGNTSLKSPGRKSKFLSIASLPKNGCRCGTATLIPGKLTCGGQRCICYAESKPCVDCKCRGCRNPHTAAGQKVIVKKTS